MPGGLCACCVREDGQINAEVILVRHGETVHTAQRRYSGRSDPPLTRYGVSQAAWTAKALANRSLRAVYSSDLARAMSTARVIAEAAHVDVTACPGFREQDFGRWERRTYEEIIGRDRSVYERWMTDVWERRAPGGESFREVCGRVSGEIGRVVCDRAEGASVIVAHAGTIAAAIMHLLQVAPQNIWSLLVAPASISVVGRSEAGWVLKTLNDTGHLRGMGV